MSMPRHAPKLLLVEDNYLLASALQVNFEHKGVQVVGPVGDLSAALELIASGQHLDCAVLDVKLGDEPVFPVAEALLARGVRIAFLTGYSLSALPAAYRDSIYFSKHGDLTELYRWVLGS